MQWLRDAAQGKIAKKEVSQQAQAHAEEILGLLAGKTHTLKVMFSEVTLPKRGTLGHVNVTIEHVLGD